MPQGTNKKIISAVAGALALAAVVWFYLIPPSPPANAPAQPLDEVQIPAASSSAALPDKKSAPPEKIPSRASRSPSAPSAPETKPAAEEIRVKLLAGESFYEFAVPAGASAYEAMLALSKISAFTFESKYYSGLGSFIEAVNGVKNANGKYWTLYVNGNYSTVGASGYLLKNGDQIEWKYGAPENNY